MLQTEQSEGRFCGDSYIVRKESKRFLQQEIEEWSESSRRKEGGCFTFKTSVIDVMSLPSVDSYKHYEWKILKYWKSEKSLEEEITTLSHDKTLYRGQVNERII